MMGDQQKISVAEFVDKYVSGVSSESIPPDLLGAIEGGQPILFLKSRGRRGGMLLEAYRMCESVRNGEAVAVTKYPWSAIRILQMQQVPVKVTGPHSFFPRLPSADPSRKWAGSDLYQIVKTHD